MVFRLFVTDRFISRLFVSTPACSVQLPSVRFNFLLYKREVTLLQQCVQHMRLPRSRALRCHPNLSHPVFRRAPRDGTVGLRNPTSCDPVRERGDQVFGEHPHATIGLSDNTTAAE